MSTTVNRNDDENKRDSTPLLNGAFLAAKLVTVASLLGMVVCAGVVVQHTTTAKPMLQDSSSSSSSHHVRVGSSRDLSQGRIVGGTAAVKGAYPWIVSLRNSDGDDWSWAVCGGSLITPSIVLTGEFYHTHTYTHTHTHLLPM